MDNNEYDTGSDVGYDDYESDFDLSGEMENDGGVPDTVDSEIDAIADLISGNSEKADALSAQREKTGAQSKVARQSINLDANGHKVFHQSSPEPKAESQTSDTVYASEVRQAQSHAQSEWDAAHAENDRLNDLLSSGQMSAEEHYRLTQAQGQRAGAAKELMYQSTIQELMHGRQVDEQHKALEKTLGDAWKPENRQQTTRDLIDWAEKSGLSRETLANVETESEAMAIYNAMKNEKELETTKMELKAAKALLKKQHQQLKGRRRKMSKDASTGQRNADAISQVADLLSEHGISGGRR